MNAEIWRFYKHDFNLSKFILAPVILLFIFSIMISGGDDGILLNIIHTSLFFSFIIFFLWGGDNTAQSIVEDQNNRNFDRLRLSSLSPTSLTLGKLFGSNLYPYYVAIPMIVLIITLSVHIESAHHIYMLSIFLCFFIFCQSLGGMIALRRTRSDYGRPMGFFGPRLLSIIIGLSISSALDPTLQGIAGEKNFLGVSLSHSNYTIFYAASLMIWAVLGFHRGIRTSFGLKNGPTLWILFVIHMISLHNSTTPSDTINTEYLNMFVAPFIVTTILLYGCLFWQKTQISTYNKALSQLKNKNFLISLNYIPLWVFSFIITLTVAIFGIITVPENALKNIQISSIETTHITSAIICCMLIIIRDISLFHLFSLDAKVQSPVWKTFVFIILLNILFPMLFASLDLDFLAVMFLPKVSSYDILMTYGSYIGQIGFILFLIWRNIHGLLKKNMHSI